jgi:hypothetical protein
MATLSNDKINMSWTKMGLLLSVFSLWRKYLHRGFQSYECIHGHYLEGVTHFASVVIPTKMDWSIGKQTLHKQPWEAESLRTAWPKLRVCLGLLWGISRLEGRLQSPEYQPDNSKSTGKNVYHTRYVSNIMLRLHMVYFILFSQQGLLISYQENYSYLLFRV